MICDQFYNYPNAQAMCKHGKWEVVFEGEPIVVPKGGQLQGPQGCPYEVPTNGSPCFASVTGMTCNFHNGASAMCQGSGRLGQSSWVVYCPYMKAARSNMGGCPSDLPKNDQSCYTNGMICDQFYNYPNAQAMCKHGKWEVVFEGEPIVVPKGGQLQGPQGCPYEVPTNGSPCFASLTGMTCNFYNGASAMCQGPGRLGQSSWVVYGPYMKAARSNMGGCPSDLPKNDQSCYTNGMVCDQFYNYPNAQAMCKHGKWEVVFEGEPIVVPKGGQLDGVQGCPYEVPTNGSPCFAS